MENGKNHVEKNKIYEELGINYRHFLSWRYAAIFAVGIIDFAAYKIIVESHLTKFIIIICTIFLIIGLFLLILWELRSTEIYRMLISKASEIEIGELKNVGSYTILESFKKPKDKNEKEWNRERWGKVLTIFHEDKFRPTHLGFILWFIISSIVIISFITVIGIFKPAWIYNTIPSKSEKRFDRIDSTLHSITSEHEKRFDSLDSKFDSILIQLQKRCTETKPSSVSPSDGTRPRATYATGCGLHRTTGKQ